LGLVLVIVIGAIDYRDENKTKATGNVGAGRG
jgi:hypothetical protein